MQLISIIIPIYNSKHFFEKCINSVLTQSYKNIEIIIVDDGSNDKNVLNTLNLISDSRVKYIQQEHKGVSAARNTGLSNATGEYILFLDSDDYLESNACETLINTVNLNQNADIIFFNFRFHKNNLNKVFYYQNLNVKKMLLNVLPFNKVSNNILELNYVVWNKLYKTDFIKENQLVFIEGCNLCEDMLFVLELFSKNPKVSLIYDVLYNYTIRDDSLSSIASQKMLDIFDELYKFAIQQTYYQGKYKYFVDNIFLKAYIFAAYHFKNQSSNLLYEKIEHSIIEVRKQKNVNVLNSYRYRKIINYLIYLKFIMIFKKT